MKSIGDKVSWVPSVDHATDQDRDQVFAWSFRKWDERQGKATDKEMTDAEVSQLINQIHSYPPRRDQLVPFKPRTSWPAAVREVNEDGTLNLDIQHCLLGVTLHYDKVREDPSGKTPGTWH